jgi:Tfp pilus assembly protein PilN
MNAPNQLNFLPEDYLVRKAQYRTNVICATLFIFMISGIAIAFTIAERAMRGAEQRHASVERQYTDAAKRIQLMQTMRQKQLVLARQAELSASLIDRVPRSYMLAEITNLLPQGVYLTDLDMEMRKKSSTPVLKTAFEKKTTKVKKEPTAKLPPPPDPYDTVVRIGGVAETDAQVAKVISAVKDSKIFRDVNLLISTQMDRTETNALRRFTLEMTLNPTADSPQSTIDKTVLTQVQP